jgi:hypothetical protein
MKGGEMMDYLPEVYQQFERRYPTVKEAFDALGAAEHDAGPLGERERCSASASLRRRSCIRSFSPSPLSVFLLPTPP